MTPTPPSRTTLADLITLIEKANLMPTQKRDQVSAVKTTARLLGARPVEIDADPGKLRKRLETIAPEALGLSRGRWNNIRSLIGKALALARTNTAGTTNGSLAARVASAFRAALAESGGGLEGHGAVFECEKRSTRRGDGRGFRGLSQGYRQRPAPGQARGDLGCDRLDLERLQARGVRLAGYRDPSWRFAAKSTFGRGRTFHRH